MTQAVTNAINLKKETTSSEEVEEVKEKVVPNIRSLLHSLNNEGVFDSVVSTYPDKPVRQLHREVGVLLVNWSLERLKGVSLADLKNTLNISKGTIDDQLTDQHFTKDLQSLGESQTQAEWYRDNRFSRGAGAAALWLCAIATTEGMEPREPTFFSFEDPDDLFNTVVDYPGIMEVALLTSFVYFAFV